ncbi:MAG: hypothetical protein HY366_00115 [Candidatus Aenigmarchaeota archaeon]|nr:hypothetical protein [Candidatus Aenigmarchaeota archaeon]
MKSVKGISPLIATVLLIAFVIAAAGILSNFVLPFTRERASEVSTTGTQNIKCSFANIFVKEAKWNSTTTTLSLTIENNGRESLKNFRASVLRTNNTVTNVLLAPLTAELLPGSIDTLSNATHIGTCSDISSVVTFADTCPNDARDEVKKAAIQSCS